MFGVNPTQLGFPGPPQGATVEERAPLPERGTSMDRRDFIQDAVGVAAGGLPPLSPVGRSGTIGATHVLDLREGLASLYRLDDAYGGGGEVRSLARRHLRRIRRLINGATYPDSIGRQLQLLAGETAEHVAWLAFDAADHEAARAHWGEALASATMLGDRPLEFLVFAGLSHQATYLGHPQDGVAYARAAHDRATRLGSPVLRSLIAVREVRALTAMRDKAAAGRRLAEAVRLMDRAGRGGAPTPAWAECHGPASLSEAQSAYYLDTGSAASAVPFARAAVARESSAYGRNTARRRVSLARTLIRAGEPEEGAACVLDSLTHLQDVQSARITTLLREVREQLSPVDTPTTREAVDAITHHMKGAA